MWFLSAVGGGVTQSSRAWLAIAFENAWSSLRRTIRRRARFDSGAAVGASDCGQRPWLAVTLRMRMVSSRGLCRPHGEPSEIG